MTTRPWTLADDGVRLHVRVTPKAGRDGIDGVGTAADGRSHLAVRVAAPPEDGATTAAVVRLVAKALGVRVGDVTVESGATARMKRLRVDGDATAIVARLEDLA